MNNHRAPSAALIATAMGFFLMLAQPTMAEMPSPADLAIEPGPSAAPANVEVAQANQAVLLASGTLKNGERRYKGSGSAGIYQLADGSYLLRFEDFKVTNGPDLRVLLVEHPDPANRDDVQPGYVDLGRLKGNKGNQNYVIPETVDLSKYSSVIIYCRAFHSMFSSAPLTKVG